ncbi:MAG: hypothetical protein Q4D58_01890 [Synergistaceae bacterium]|nr:hypothetical protein [Synergistaceae bacterium]
MIFAGHIRRKFMAAAAVMLMTVSFMSVGASAKVYDEKDPPKVGERARHIIFDVLNKTKHPVFLKYRAEMDMDGEKLMTLCTLAMKGNITFLEMESKAQHMSVISDAGDHSHTLIMHGDKMYMKMKDSPIKLPVFGEPTEGGEEAKSSAPSYSAGSEDIGGKIYDYDKLIEKDSEPQSFYFNVMTDEWKYWLNSAMSDKLIEILEYGAKVDDALFKVPSGYQEMKMPY